MWCAEGLRAVKLTEVQQLRFTNPVIESEFRRALEVLALIHDSAEEGGVASTSRARASGKVQVGYVIEAPIWKTELPARARREQGEAVPAGVGDGREPDRRGLGRRADGADQRPADQLQDGPVQPAVRRRPTVEPELFASLRPADLRGGVRQATQRRRRRTSTTPEELASRRPRSATDAEAGGRARAGGAGVAGGAAERRCRREGGRRTDDARSAARASDGRAHARPRAAARTRPSGSAPARVGNAATAASWATSSSTPSTTR